MSQITLFGKDNRELIKSPMIIGEASWFEDGAGRLTYRIPKGHPFAKYEYLRVGTRVLAEVDGFPEPWVGFIEPPRKWGNGFVEINCKDMKYLFHYRRARFATDKGVLSSPITLKGTPGAIAREILRYANTKRDTGIVEGDIFDGGDEGQETLNDMLDDHLDNIANRNSCVWSVTADNRDGVLTMELNFLPKTFDLVDYLLEEGVNMETNSDDIFLTEDGDIYNDVLGIGDVVELGEPTPAFELDDEDYIDEFDLRQTMEVFMGNKELDRVKINTQAFLGAHLIPGATLNPVLPYTPEIASKLFLGCSMPLRLHSAGISPNGDVGFDAYVRNSGVTYRGETQNITLIVSGT